MSTRYTCLYVDDDCEDREIFAMAAEELPVRLITASNGTEALSLLEKEVQAPDYIFLDVRMPLINGLDMLDVLTSLPKLRSTGIILYSDYSDDIVAANKHLGVAAVVKKFAHVCALKKYLSETINYNIA